MLHVFTSILLPLLVAALCLAFFLWSLRRAVVKLKLLGWRGVALLGGALVSVGVMSVSLLWGGYGLWVRGGDRTPIIPEQLHAGVTYEKRILETPRRAVMHVVRVDLGTPNLKWFVTPRASKGDRLSGRAQITSAIVAKHNLLVAVNGAYFTPFMKDTPWGYAPRVGDPVTPLGVWVCDGKTHAWNQAMDAYLVCSAAGAWSAGKPTAPGEKMRHAATGRCYLLREGVAPDDLKPGKPYPRTVLGLDAAAATFYMVVVDGKQPGYSEGLTLTELAAELQSLGVHDAIELDGGGSATMAARPGNDGEPVLLSRPIHTRLPGRERPVANHVGFYVASSD